ncbi:hypothetical protein [Pseudomonas syringae]|uniref:hypothetical protein n=1 Tax=Pseudomonas syringae TaxID=317 RepID=UPI000409651B|nr:hypothetical protein [Pseudomonas syringae]
MLVIPYQWGVGMIARQAVMGMYSLHGAVYGRLFTADQRSRDVRRPRGHDRE